MSVLMNCKSIRQLIINMETLYEEAHSYYKLMYQRMVDSTRRVKLTSEHTNELHKTFSNFARDLENVTKRFNQQILQESEGQNERLMNSYQVFSNSLLKIADIHRKMAAQIKNQVVDPYLMFIENYRETNRGIAKKANSILGELDKQREIVQKSQQNYYQSWVKTQKSKQDIEKAIQKIQKGGKNNDLLKANQISLRLTMVTEELERQYRQNVDKINLQWKLLTKQYQSMCSLFEYNEQTRLYFSRSTVITALRVFTEFNQLNESQVQAKTKDSEDMIKLATTKEPLIKSLANGKFAKFLQLEKKQSFVSFQDSRKRKQSIKQDKANPQNEIFKTVPQKDRDTIQNLLDFWLQDTLNKSQSAPKPESPTKPTVISLQRPAIQQAKQIVLSSSAHSLFMIETLYNKITKLSSYYCKLDQQPFLDLLLLFIKISKSLQGLVNERSIEYLYKMINISMRVMKKKKDKSGQPRELLCTLFGKDNPLFLNEKLWIMILNYINQRALKKKKDEEDRSSVIGKGFAILSRVTSFIGKKEQTNKDSDTFAPTQEIVSLISSLSVSTEFSLPLVRKMLNGQLGPAFQFLKESLYSKQDIQLRQKLTQPKEQRLRKQQKMLKLIEDKKVPIHVLKIVSKSGFLDVKDISIRLVCKAAHNYDKYILSQLNIPKKWMRILHVKQLDYPKLKQQADTKGISPAVEQIITLDVNRSLHAHTSYLTPAILTSILKTFVYNDKHISYCQGMNYLAGYLFIRLRDETQAYCLFDILMRDKFGELFANEFELLKVKIFQFERLLKVFLPDIAEHFKRQLISADCYMVSWIITLYSATFQTAKQSYLVDFLWDQFIVYGWREFFKFTLFVFNLFKDELVECTFDKALNFLSQLTKTELFTSNYEQLLAYKRFDVRTLLAQVNTYHVTNSLLLKLRKQYEQNQTFAQKS